MDNDNTASNLLIPGSHRWRKLLIMIAVLFFSALMLGTWLTAFAAPDDKTGSYPDIQPAAPTDLDFSIVKSAREPFIVGSGNRYTIRAASTGSLGSAINFAVEDQLPEYVTIVDPDNDILAEDWDCDYTASSRTLYCDFIGEIQSGNAQYLPIILSVNVAQQVAPIIENTARLLVEGDNVDPNPDNNEDTIQTIVDSVDLSLEKSVEPTYADVGIPVEYTLVVKNDGPALAEGVEVIDILPAGVDYDCANSSSDPVGFQCTLVEDTDEFTATWSLLNVPDGQTITLTLPATPDVDATGEDLVNTATVTSTNASDWDTSNNEDSAEFFVSGLEIEKFVDQAAVFVGDHYLYTIEVYNGGTQSASNVRVRDIFDPGLDIVSSAYRIGSGNWIDFSTNNTMNRFIGALDTDETATVAVTVRGNETVVVSTTVTNTATVTASPNVERPSGTVTTTIQAAADLEADTSDGPEEVTAGESYVYTLEVENIGSITATNIIITDRVSEYLSITSVDPGNLTLTRTHNSARRKTWEVDGEYGPLEGFQLEIGVRVANDAPPGTLLNNTIEASTTTTETWLANNTYTSDDTEVLKEPKPSDMKIELSRDPGQGEVGDTIRFEVDVKNEGDEAATDVVVFDDFPSVLDIIGVKTNRGTATTNASARSVTVRLDTLNPNQTIKIEIETRVNSTASGNEIYEHQSLVEWNPDNEEDSNTVRFRVVGSDPTLPSTGGVALAPISPFISLAIGVGLLLVFLGIGALIYSLWSRSHRPLWTAWFGRTGVILLIIGLGLTLLGFVFRGESQDQPQLALVSDARLPLATIPSPTSPPTLKTASSEEIQSWEPTPTPSSLPDYPIPTPPSPSPGVTEPDRTPVNRIIIPQLGVDTVVKFVPFDGQSWLIGGLKQEVAWMGDTAWPGLGGNTGLAGHVDLSDGSDGPFRNLSALEPGDEVILYTEENMYFYQVRAQAVVDEDDLSVIDPTDDPQLTLITCTDWDQEFRVYLSRLIVYSDLVEIKSISDPQTSLPIENLSGAASFPKVDKAAEYKPKDEPAAEAKIEYQSLASTLSDAGIDPDIPGRKAIYIDQNEQRLYLFNDGEHERTLPISSGTPQYFTPAYTGHVKYMVDTIHSVEGLLADHAWYLFSSTGRIYIHGAPYELDESGEKTYIDLDLIGSQPASHGCIRLDPVDALWFTDWNPEGAAIVISEPPQKIISQ